MADNVDWRRVFMAYMEYVDTVEGATFLWRPEHVVELAERSGQSAADIQQVVDQVHKTLGGYT